MKSRISNAKAELQTPQTSEATPFSGETLRQSESQLRLIWEKALDGMRLCDGNGTIRMVNEAYCRMVGLPREELEGQPMSIVYEASRHAEVLRKHRHRFQRRKIRPHLESDLVLWDGRKASFELSNSFLEFDGKPALSLTIFRDITQRKRNQFRASAVSEVGQKLSSCRNRAEAAHAIKVITAKYFSWDAFSLDLHSPETSDFVAVLNVDTINGQKIEVPAVDTGGCPTERAQRVMQHGAELILKQDAELMLHDAIPFGDAVRPSASIMAVPLRHGRNVLGVLSIQSYETKAFDSDDLRTLEILADSCGGALERIRAEAALCHSEVRFQSIWENSVDGMRLTDENGIILAVNDAYCELVGMKREELEGRPFSAVYAETERRDEFVEKYKERFQKRIVQKRMTRRIRFRSGKTAELEDTNSFIEADGKTLLLGLFRDITTQKRLEEELRQSQKMESIGQLAGGIAHDFNNILTIINGHAALLSTNNKLPAHVSESAEQIVHAAERAANLTRQLLAFSRKQVIQPRHLDLNEIVANMTKMLQRVLGEDISLQVDFHGGLPPVRADSGMLEQILLNLAVNSRDAMPSGGQLSIGTSLEFIDEKRAQKMNEARVGQFVCLHVNDTGCGIPQELLSKIFEPFFTTKDVGKGTGLGLATVYGIVKQHHGWIDVTSKQGEGATFCLFFPAASGRAEQQARTSQPMPRGGKETILVVEDQPEVCALVLTVLKPLGYRCLQAHSGIQALEVWREHRDTIDLVLTDVVMPDGISGRELAEMLQPEKPGLKVVFTSGYPKDVLGTNLILRDGIHFLQKPYPPQKLAQTIRECLDGTTILSREIQE